MQQFRRTNQSKVVDSILEKEAKWICKEAGDQDWLEREVTNPATGNKVKVKSLPPEERKKYKPKKDKKEDLKKKLKKKLDHKNINLKKDWSGDTSSYIFAHEEGRTEDPKHVKDGLQGFDDHFDGGVKSIHHQNTTSSDDAYNGNLEEKVKLHLNNGDKVEAHYGMGPSFGHINKFKINGKEKELDHHEVHFPNSKENVDKNQKQLADFYKKHK